MDYSAIKVEEIIFELMYMKPEVVVIRLPKLLKQLNKTEKISVMTELLADEWYTHEQVANLNKLLTIFANSIRDEFTI